MKRLAVLLVPCLVFAAAGIEPVVTTGPGGTPQTWYRVNTGTGYVNPAPLANVAGPVLPTDTGVLWVDRNHRYAICQATGISADGRHIFANWYLNAQRAAYYRTLGDEVPVWESPGDYAWAWDGHAIGISQDASAMSLAATARTDEWSRNSQFPNWTYNHPMPNNAYSRCSRDGNRVVTVCNGELRWFLASNGALVWSASVPEPGSLQGLAVSDDGSIVAVTVYDSCLVYDGGARRAGIPIGTASSGTQYAAAMSGDGSIIATGDYYGHMKLWRWSGSSYVLRWTATVGTPWVAGVAVSRDGSRVACGTGYQNGQLCVFDSSSSTPVMVYQNYGVVGAYIPSVALSDNGARVAAASWGDTALSGTSRVFTVHNVGDTAPLVAITRDDEPGSIFTCDISGDGQFATCGGKAVHAYRFGNGGEVYAVMVGASARVDAGTYAIDQPTRHIQVDTAIMPQSDVRNYGDTTVAVPVHLEIYNSADSLLYHDSAVTFDLPPGATTEVDFSQFTPDTFGLYRFVFYTALPGDGYGADDTMVMEAKCFHDALVTRVGPPGAENTIHMAQTPVLVARNNGSYSDAVRCFLRIADSAGTVVYLDSALTATLAPEDTAQVRMTSWSPPYVGDFTATGWTRLAEDFDPSNDTLQKPFQVTYEIMYDDGVPETYYWVGRLDNDKFYVRFTPTLAAPLSLTHGRVWVNAANTPFDYVMVCKGSGQKPDTLSPLQIVDNVTAPTAPAWADFDLDITLHSTDDVWVILHWPSGSPVLGVGADATPPIDLRSYFSSNQDTFRLWTADDWMVRLTQSTEVGITGAAADRPASLRLLTPNPNPFTRTTMLGYEVPAAAHVVLSIYDGTGRLVATPVSGLAQPGRYRLAWNGCDDAGRPLAPGLYFARLRSAGSGSSSVHKLVLTR